MTVLFVDDDVEDREFFMDALSYVDAGIRCVLAKNGEEAVQMIQRGSVRPEYVFLDINMPPTGGRKALTVIKEDPALKDIRVVMYSNSSDPKLIEEYKALGASYFLVKPSTFKALCDALSIMFDKE